MATKAKIGVLGASGYTGSELVRMLLRHPRAEIVLLTAERSAGKAMRDVFPQFSPFDLPTLVAIEGLNWEDVYKRQDPARVTGQRLVHGVVDDFGEQVVQRLLVGAADIPVSYTHLRHL